MSTETKKFTLRTLLTVTTGRLLTEPEGPNDNGIGRMYQLLGWMTDDQPFTHQLGRFAEECKPWLLRWFPEIAPCGVQSSLDSLDKWRDADRTERKTEFIKMWIAEQKLMFPELKDEYEVPHIPSGTHTAKDPIAELIELRESKEGIIVVKP
jgi:hypothetical protein